VQDLLEFHDELRDFLAREVRPHIEQWEAQRSYPIRQLIRQLGAAGVFGRCHTNEQAHAPRSYLFNKVLHETLADLPGALLGSCINNHLDSGLSLLSNNARNVQLQDWVRDCLAGRRIVTLASTEQHSGSDVRQIKTTAIKSGTHYVLNGAKWFISNATIADGIFVLARTGNSGGAFDFSLFLVPCDHAGVRIEPIATLGLRGGTIGALDLVDVELPTEHLLGVAGMGLPLTIKQFEKERLSLAIRAASIAEFHLRHLECSAAPDRLSRTLAEQLCSYRAEIARLRCFTEHVMQLRFSAKPLAVPTAMLKLMATRLAKDVAAFVMRTLGASCDNDIALRFYRDVKAMSMSGGSDEMMLMTIGSA